ncbi:hypothetical protein HDU96_010687, partial [Phlyctochytrium bullatum]
MDKLRRFATDPSLQALYILKERTEAKTGKSEDDDGATGAFSYTVAVELSFGEKHVASLVLIKRTAVLMMAETLSKRCILTFTTRFHLSSTHSLVPKPYLYKALQSETKRNPRQVLVNLSWMINKITGIPMAKKKIAELELSLLQLQQNVEIPEVSLSIHPIVQRAVEKFRDNDLKPSVDAIGDHANDSTFLNRLQSDVNGWIKEIHKVTKFHRDPSTGTASQEINYWLSMERALSQIEEQLKSDFVVFTLDILRHAKRFHATVSFLADTGLKEATEKVQKYNQLMRDFPLNELLSATDVEKIKDSISLIFGHLNKKLKLSPYPIRRALPLVSAISKDLNEQLLKVLGSRRLMHLDYEDFERATSGCEDVFRTWEEQIKEFTNVAREVTRKRSEKILPIKINNAHSKLQERINFIRAFRRQHEQLHNTIVKVMKPDKSSGMEKGVNLSDVNALDDVNLAYESIKSIDVLDVSPEGTEIWVSAENSYNERVARVENQIIARLRDRLGTAKNANEMFRVFSKFNALFVRPKIRGAIQEYQTQLIENVKEDIKRLHDKFKMQYRNSEAYHMSQWLAEITKRDLNVSGRIFEISRNRAQGNILTLGINFDSQIITLFKEVRNLLWFGYQVPHTVANVAKDAKRVYPFAVSLSETVRTYTQTVTKTSKNDVIAPLVAAYRKDVQTHISKGIQLRWDYFVNTNYRENRHVIFVREFASLVSIFQDKVNTAIAIYDDIKYAIEELKSCVFIKEKFQDILDRIQKAVHSWTSDLDTLIEETLAKRLDIALLSWVREFHNQVQDHTQNYDIKKKMRGRRGTIISVQAEDVRRDDSYQPIIKAITFEIRMKNQTMYLDPPIEYARQNFYHQLHDWLGYDAIENTLSNVISYVKVWLQYQNLWDLEGEYVYSRLGDNLASWQQLVLEIKKARSTFDNSETEKSFGVIVIDYGQVQSKVNAKYDQWQREILNRFGARLGVGMKDFFAVVSKARSELEMQSVEGNSTAEAVSFITYVQDLKRKLSQWSDDMEVFRQSQKVLERQRFLFPSDWLFIDNVEGEWSAFNEILSRKNASIQEQIGGLQMKILAEEKIVKQRIDDVIGEWHKSKPIKGDIQPQEATSFLVTFEVRANRVKEDYDLVCRAREALNLDLVTDLRLDPLFEELKDLKSVWVALSQVWTSLYEVKDTLWSAVVPRRTKQQLDTLLASTKEMPNKMRQYAAFEYMQDTLKSYLKLNTILTDLKSEALRERHWKQIFKVLSLETSLLELTIGHVWDSDLRKHETALRDIITSAQGEMALEEFIRGVRETWTSYSLELVNYQNKCRLIKGWDDLFAKCSEHLNSLTAMRHSPYYKVFEEEASAWEDKLNRTHLLFDVWIDVQRQWVYLEGIFSGNTDIKALLPVESQRFQNINSEFMNAMKKVYKSPLVMDVLNVPGIQKSLERLADLLTKIQKALGEYLERERSSFPRFYFVGDEDLLDIIGNSKEIARIQKHFKKMFAGISRIVLSDDGAKIVGFVSKEGEEVSLKNEILVSSYQRINDWLSALEKEMKNTLAFILADSIESLLSFYFAESVSESTLIDWIDKYPAQLVVLAVQTVWTQAVEKSFVEKDLDKTLQIILRSLTLLADVVLRDLPSILRRKCEHLITELVHQRDV